MQSKRMYRMNLDFFNEFIMNKVILEREIILFEFIWKYIELLLHLSH